jgi:hypothetical protein
MLAPADGQRPNGCEVRRPRHLNPCPLSVCPLGGPAGILSGWSRVRGRLIGPSRFVHTSCAIGGQAFAPGRMPCPRDAEVATTVPAWGPRTCACKPRGPNPRGPLHVSWPGSFATRPYRFYRKARKLGTVFCNTRGMLVRWRPSAFVSAVFAVVLVLVTAAACGGAEENHAHASGTPRGWFCMQKPRWSVHTVRR